MADVLVSTQLQKGIYWNNGANALSFETNAGLTVNTANNKYGEKFRIKCTNSGETTGVYSNYFWFAICEICGTDWDYYFVPKSADTLPSYQFDMDAATFYDGTTTTTGINTGTTYTITFDLFN